MSSFLFVVDFIAKAHPSRTATPCALSSYFRGTRRLACYSTPADRKATDVPTRNRQSRLPLPISHRSRQRPPSSRPSVPVLANLGLAGRSRIERPKLSLPPECSSVTPVEFSLGFWASGPAPFDVRTLEKRGWEGKSEFHGFLSTHGPLRVDSRPRRPRFGAIPFLNQSLLPGVEKRGAAIKFFRTFSLTEVIPDARPRRPDNLWITSHNSLLQMSFF